jgi:N-acyl-D-amino-acid deacylase
LEAGNVSADVLIKNGLVIDGSGKAGEVRPVAIKGDRLYLPRPGEAVQAKVVVDAQGLVVAPGFIDIHSHTTLNGLVRSKGGSKLSQGITTEITGNCGAFPSPYTPENLETLSSVHNMDWSLPGYRRYLQQFQTTPISHNLGFLIGHGSVRAAVMGYEDRKPTAAELEKMKEYVAEGMEHGAMGMSTGLGYPPGIFSEIDELVELYKVVAKYGGIHATHMRDEGDELLESIDEAIAISRRSGASLQVSHLKATGKPNWGKVVAAREKLEAARREGLDVNYDFYPYTACSTGLSSQLPNWVHEGGWSKSAVRLQEPETRARILAEVKDMLEEAVGWHNYLITLLSEKNRHLEGKNLAEIAEIRGQHPAEAMLDLLLEEEGDIDMIKFAMTEADVRTVAAGELSMVGTDGSAELLNDPHKRKPHPRAYGSFPRVLRLFWREQGLYSLEALIAKMTAVPARKLKLNGRGLIADGYFADLVLFDPETIGDTATYANPHQLAAGIHKVYVNGALAYEEGRFLDPKSGVMVKPSI